MNIYDHTETTNYEIENWGINLLKTRFGGSLQIMTNSELDYKSGVDLIYNNKSIDLKSVNDRSNICLSFYRENRMGNWYSPLPSKSDVIWYLIHKPEGGVLYEIDQNHQSNMIQDIPNLQTRFLNNRQKYGRRQVVLYAAIRDRYCRLIDFIPTI